MTALERFLKPRSIAVIGGGFWGRNIIDQLIKIGFDGPIGVVHPKADQIKGIPCVRDLSELDFIPDAAFVGINRQHTPAIVGQLADMGAGGAVCFASGFDEAANEDTKGASLQAQLLDAAGDMPILGPNCYGFINVLDRACLWPDQHGCTPVERGVAIITQSSNISINLTMQQRGLPIAYMVTAGNQAQVDMADIGHALLNDPRVSALGLHIEGIKDLNKFTALAQHSAQMGKPIIALKVGASDAAQAASITHTASLAGSHSSAQALFDRLGIVSVNNLPEFLSALNLAHHMPDLNDATIMSFSCSGGEASIMADAAARTGVDFPPINSAQRDGLDAVLGPMVHLSNPLDYHTYIWGDLPAMRAMFAAGFAGPAALNVVVLDLPSAQRCDPNAWTQVLDPIAAAAAQSNNPVGVLASLPENLPDDWSHWLVERNLIPLHGIDDTLSAIAALGKRQKVQIQPVLQAPSAKNPQIITEFAAKSMLADSGLTVAPNAYANNASYAVRAADQIGYPVVLKTQGAAHKSDIGGVHLNLKDAAAVQAAADLLPDGPILVEKMIDGGIAELLLGVMRDPAHGFVLTIGAGGVLTELLHDTQQITMPADQGAIRAAIKRLRVSKLIHGYRGKPAANLDSIITAVQRLQSFVIEHATQLAEVEINPLICTADHAIVADALIRMDCAKSDLDLSQTQ